MPIISLARPVSLPPVGDAAAATDGAVPTLRALGGPYATAEEEDGRVLCRGSPPRTNPNPYANPSPNSAPTRTSLTSTVTSTSTQP